MLIKKHRKIKFLLRDLKTKGAITNADTTDHEEFRLSWVINLANQIANLAPDLLNMESLNIIVAGVDQEAEAPTIYQLLNRLLGTNINFHIRLVGPGARVMPFEICRLQAPYQDARVQVSIHKTTLGEELKNSGLPDLISLNSPGLEEHHEEWLVKDRGLIIAHNECIPILGGSYGKDEYATDDSVFRRYGYQIKEHTVNSLAHTPSGDHSPYPEHIVRLLRPAQERGEFAIMGTLWRLDIERHIPDSSLHEAYEYGANAIKDIVLSLHENELASTSLVIPPCSQYPVLFRKSDKSEIYVAETLVYSFESKKVFNCLNGDVFAENIDLSDFSGRLNTYFELALFISHIQNEHIEMVDGAIDFCDTSEDFSFDPSESPSLDDLMGFLGDIDPDYLENMMQAIQGNRVDHSRGPKISNESEFLEFLRSSNATNIESFRTEDGTNAVNLACRINNIEAVKELQNKGVSFSERDLDNFSCLDTCAADASYEVLSYILENKMAVDMINNKAPINGFLPAHHAGFRKNLDCLELLKDNGTDMQTKNMEGLSPADFLR